MTSDFDPRLDKAIKSDNAKALKELLAAEPALAHENHGWSPLMLAARCGAVECARVLIPLNDVSFVDWTTSRSALSLAADNKKLEVVCLLLKAGAPLDEISTKSVLHCDGLRMRHLHIAVARNHYTEAVAIMSINPLSVLHDTTTGSQYSEYFPSEMWKSTPLHIAAYLGHIKIGRDIKQKDKTTLNDLTEAYKNTPAMTARDIAVKMGHTKFVEMLDSPSFVEVKPEDDDPATLVKLAPTKPEAGQEATASSAPTTAPAAAAGAPAAAAGSLEAEVARLTAELAAEKHKRHKLKSSLKKEQSARHKADAALQSAVAAMAARQ